MNAQAYECHTLEELMEVWREKHFSEGKNSFIVDGIVNEERWSKSKYKICFLLKESYISPEEYEYDMTLPDKNLKTRHWNAYIRKEKNGQYVYDMPKHQKEHEPWFMWRRVETWLKRIYLMLGEEVSDPVQEIAVLDIKKSEGKSQSEYNDILSFAKSDRDLIRREIELIDPDIIICGATYGYCVEANIFDDLEEIAILDDFKGRLIARAGERLIIDCYHPAAPSVSYDKAEAFFKAVFDKIKTLDAKY